MDAGRAAEELRRLVIEYLKTRSRETRIAIRAILKELGNPSTVEIHIGEENRGLIHKFQHG